MTAARPLALVTGARRGIGAAIATEFAACGFDVAIADVPGEEPADVIRQVSACGGAARFFPFDLADLDSHDPLVDAVEGWHGPVTTLVNNAGIGAPARGDLLDVPAEAFDRVLDVNLRGTFFLTQRVARRMVSRLAVHGRSIVNVSSVSADMASIERGEYCVSKSGLAMVTKLFALRLAESGIGVFEVRPGVIRTPMTASVASRYDQRIEDGLVPMARWGLPEDVAHAVAMVGTGHAAFATGSVIHVDGALSIPRF